MKFIDLHLNPDEKDYTVEEVFKKYSSNINYVYALKPGIEALFVQHAAEAADFVKEGVRFLVKKGFRKSRWQTFLFLFLELRQFKPKVILLHGMVYPVQIILAKIVFGRHTKLIIQHHAEKPYSGFWGLMQKVAGYCVSAFLVVSKKQAAPWIQKGIIASESLVYEVMEGSNGFEAADYINEDKEAPVFLWVGRLDANKDPLCVLRAFKEFVKVTPRAQLHMIYGSTDLLADMELFIGQADLEQHVRLIGFVKHAYLESYFKYSDYFILASHYEGSGYALCEAMACGCVPIVSNIPSFRRMLNDGDCGYLFEPGNDRDLLEKMLSLNADDYRPLRKKVLRKFETDLSFEAIANNLSELILKLGKD